MQISKYNSNNKKNRNKQNIGKFKDRSHKMVMVDGKHAFNKTTSLPDESPEETRNRSVSQLNAGYI